MSNKNKINIAIYGAGGLTGKELLSLLRKHPYANPVFLSSNKYAGQTISSVFTDLVWYDNKSSLKEPLKFCNHSETLPENVDIVFLAVPNQNSLELVPKLLKHNIPFIDLSGSFRLNDQNIWEKYYKLKHTAFEIMPKLTFGLPEIFRDKIKQSKAIANPGCYPTASIIALNLLGKYRTQLQSIVIDAKSGVSGAGGRTEDAGFSYQSVYENFRAYKILGHQHQPEIEEYGSNSLEEGFDCPLTFTPHLLPVNRGILSTLVLHWKNSAPTDLRDIFRQQCSNEPFLRFKEEPEEIELTKVQNTNFVDLSLRSEENITVIVTAIDNLIKGAAGQAIQNMNIMHAIPETTGLL